MIKSLIYGSRSDSRVQPISPYGTLETLSQPQNGDSAWNGLFGLSASHWARRFVTATE